jgi:hypothetical protein
MALLEDDAWFGGVQKCFVSIALANIVWIVPQYQSHSTAIQAPFAYEEYWQNPVPPVPLSLTYPQPWIFDEQTPALFPQPDEDFWNNPVPPVPLTFQWPQQWTFDEQTPVLYAPANEEYWQNPVSPVPGSLTYPQQWIYDEQIPALFSGMEEYYWQNPVAPVSSYPVPFVFTDDFSLVPQPGAFEPDEDFWLNPVAPAPLTFTLVSPWQDEQTPLLFPQPDEDFWVSGVAPVPLTLAPLYLPDPEQYPLLLGQPDEDFWVSGVAPQLWPAWTLPFTYDEVIVPQPIAFQPDEDFWVNPVTPTAFAFAPFQPWQDEQTPTLFGQPDEDFWINPVPPIMAYPVPLVFMDDGNFVRQVITGQIIWLQGGPV